MQLKALTSAALLAGAQAFVAPGAGKPALALRAEEVEADHTFTLSWAQHALVDSLVRWLGEGVADGEPAVAAAGSTA